MEFCLKQVALSSKGLSYSDIYPEPGGKKKLCLKLNLKGEVEHTQGLVQPKGLDQSSKIF